MLRAIIADDERPARAKLRRLLAEHGDVEIVGEADGGAAALDAIHALRPDVVFLDVQMPGLDGFGVAAGLDGDPLPHIVFVTAHDDFAVRAFEVHALDYLLKPVTAERLGAAVERVRRAAAARPAGGALEARMERLERMLREMDRAPARRPLERLLVTSGERSLFVPLRQVLWMEASRNYVVLHVGKETFTVRGPLSALEERLDADAWVRVNRSQLVNLDAVAHLEPWFHGEYRVVLRDGARLTWSRRYLDRAPELLGRVRAE